MSLKMNVHERNERRSLVAQQIVANLVWGNLEVATRRIIASRTKRETAALALEVARRLSEINEGDRLLGVLSGILEY